MQKDVRDPLLQRRGQWFVLAAAVLWGTTGTAQAFAPAGAQPAAVGAVRLAVGGVALGSAPILAGVLGLLVRGEHPGSRWAVSTALAIVGGSLLVAAGDSVSVDPQGVILSLGAGTAYAVYTVSSKGLLQGRSPDAVMAVVFCIGAALAPQGQDLARAARTAVVRRR